MHSRVAQLVEFHRQHGTKQKSEEWLSQRRRCLTASDAATVIGTNPYKSVVELVLSKIGMIARFTGNASTKHGEAYEEEAVRLYEKQYNTKVHEFGLLPHGTVEGLAGSPDGITQEGVLIEVKVRPDSEGTV